MKIPAPIFILLSVFLLSMCACNKYDEGPGFSLRTKTFRASDNWKIARAEKNGIDVTTSVRINVNLRSDGAMVYSDTTAIASGDSISSLQGVWEFDHDAENILLVFTDPGGGNVSARIWFILRLAVGELWVKETVGDDLYRFEFEPK
jgi:hypothetical protein